MFWTFHTEKQSQSISCIKVSKIQINESSGIRSVICIGKYQDTGNKKNKWWNQCILNLDIEFRGKKN